MTESQLRVLQLTRPLPPIRKSRETLVQAFRRVLELEREGKYERADLLCRAVLATQPHNPDVLNWYGQFQHRHGCHTVATKALYAA